MKIRLSELDKESLEHLKLMLEASIQNILISNDVYVTEDCNEILDEIFEEIKSEL